MVNAVGVIVLLLAAALLLGMLFGAIADRMDPPEWEEGES